MTTLKDLLIDLVNEAVEIKDKVKDKEKYGIDETMPEEYVEVEFKKELVDEYIELIKNRLIGE